MTSRLANPTEGLIPDLLHRAQAGAGRFMVTLCALDAPVSLRPPQSPQLKPFTFFMSPVCQPDGSKRLHLHMGYFDTLADAERWAASARRRYPGAFATVAPGMLSRPAAPAARDAAAKAESLSDTQVLKVLEARGIAAGAGDAGERNLDQIALLGPEDTGTRRALREAVSEGAPVNFAVQLRWSAEPIDVSRVRPLPVFRTLTLYAIESRRHGHCRYFLRVGFFPDPLSARQVAAQVLSSYQSAAVVPVVEPEITRAREAGTGTSAIPCLVAQPPDQESAAPEASGSPQPARSPVPPVRRTAENEAADRYRIERRAAKALWDEAESLSDSGVRHVKVEVQDHLSGRWRIIRLEEMPADEAGL